MGILGPELEWRIGTTGTEEAPSPEQQALRLHDPHSSSLDSGRLCMSSWPVSVAVSLKHVGTSVG